MNRRFDLSAAQTALLLAGAGAVMLASGLVVLALLHPPYSRVVALTGMVSLALYGAAFYISRKWESQFKEGIANHRWDNEQIERLRSIFQSLWWKVLSFVLYIAALVFMLTFSRRGVALGWSFLIPAMTASRLSLALRPPPPPKPSIDWNTGGSIQSDHRGQR